MTKDEYWQKFSETGRVADYLAYTAANSYNTDRRMDSERKANSGEDFSNTYAGFSMCDRDDSQIRTNR